MYLKRRPLVVWGEGSGAGRAGRCLAGRLVGTFKLSGNDPPLSSVRSDRRRRAPTRAEMRYGEEVNDVSRVRKLWESVASECNWVVN